MKEINIVLLKNSQNPGFLPLFSDTMRQPKEAVADMKAILSKDNIAIKYEEREADIPKDQAFIVIINDKTLEELVPLPDPSKYCGMACESCGSGESAGCLRRYVEIPESVLRLAIKKAVAEPVLK